MPNFALLNNVAHKALRVIREHSTRYGDNDMSVVTFPQEFKHAGQHRMADEPHGDEIAGVEGEVQERGEVAEELGRQVLCLVDDPYRQDLLAGSELVDAQLQITPQIRAPVARLEPECSSKRAVQVDTAEFSFGQIDRQVAMGIQAAREMA